MPKRIGGRRVGGGQRSTRSDQRGGYTPQRRAAPSKVGPHGGQRSTRSDQRGGYIHPNAACALRNTAPRSHW